MGTRRFCDRCDAELTQDRDHPYIGRISYWPKWNTNYEGTQAVVTQTPQRIIELCDTCCASFQEWAAGLKDEGLVRDKL